MAATRPTVTPALFTGARTLRPPMLSKLAVTAYVPPTRNVARFAAFSARNTIASRPSSTNRPTSVSILLRPIAHSVLTRRAEHQRGEHEIEAEYCQRGDDDRAGRRLRHALGRRLGLVSLVERDERAGEAEHHALDDAVADVVPPVDPVLHLRPERAGVDADHQRADDVAAEDTDGREHRRQQRHGDHAREEARRKHALL